MFDKDSSPVLRRGFIQSSFIGLVATGLNYSNAYNDTKKIETMANKKELLESLIACLGGPWPKPCSLEPKTKKIIN
ncbi:MAG: hypothetical protein VX016_02215, partial [Verrucomicrobiota bacterium]|nr:hypothetical protein [Verrucomicrobiota bacterium]